MIPEKIERGFKRRSEKERYRQCCAVCHIKFGTVFLGAVEAVVAICVLVGVTQQIMWKNESSSSCSRNLFRDCLIFQFNHFNITLILDYIVVLMMICILASVQSLIERMWLATLLLILAGFQTYLFSAVVRCSMYISGIEDKRRERANAFERCSERVRIAKENGLWRTTSWGGGFQQYKGQFDEEKEKRRKEPKGFRVKWNFNQNVVVEDEETPIIDKEEMRFDPKSISEKPVRTSESPQHNPKYIPHTAETPTTSQEHHREHRRSTDMRVVQSESPKKERPRHHTVAKTSSKGSESLNHQDSIHSMKGERQSRHEAVRRESNRENREPRPSTSTSPKREHRPKEIKETAVMIKPVNKHVQRPPLRSNISVESADSVAMSIASATRTRHLTRQSTEEEHTHFKIKHEKRHEQPVVKKISISSTSHPFA